MQAQAGANDLIILLSYYLIMGQTVTKLQYICLNWTWNRQTTLIYFAVERMEPGGETVVRHTSLLSCVVMGAEHESAQITRYDTMRYDRVVN